jgi:uncharacterized protein YaaR (DUF327 family)
LGQTQTDLESQGKQLDNLMHEIDLFGEIFYEEQSIQDYCDTVSTRLQNSINQNEELIDQIIDLSEKVNSDVVYESLEEMKSEITLFESLDDQKKRFKKDFNSSNRDFQEFQHTNSRHLIKYVDEKLDQLVAMFEELNIPDFDLELEDLLKFIT